MMWSKVVLVLIIIAVICSKRLQLVDLVILWNSRRVKKTDLVIKLFLLHPVLFFNVPIGIYLCIDIQLRDKSVPARLLVYATVQHDGVYSKNLLMLGYSHLSLNFPVVLFLSFYVFWLSVASPELRSWGQDIRGLTMI